MPEFFIPGVTGDRQRIDDAYEKLRASIALELGGAPRADRIFKLWSRRGRRLRLKSSI